MLPSDDRMIEIAVWVEDVRVRKKLAELLVKLKLMIEEMKQGRKVSDVAIKPDDLRAAMHAIGYLLKDTEDFEQWLV